MRTRTTQHARKPVHRITRGKVEVVIWEQVGHNGPYQASFQRRYQTQDGSIDSSESFGVEQIDELIDAVAQAAIWMKYASCVRNGHVNEADDGEGDDDRDAEI